MRPPWFKLGEIAVVLVLVAAAGLAMTRQDPSSATRSSAGTGVPPVPTTFPAEQYRPYAPPPVIRSVHGLLETTFTVRPKTFRVAGKRVRGLTYQGGFMGPTLRVRPGDTVRIHLRNELGEPTNLHSHGMYVSPIGISDNVLRTMKAHSDNDFVLKLPRIVDPGTYWYHTHLHGLVEEQVFAGLSGVLIVEGLQQRLPQPLRDVPDRLLALKDLQVKRGAIVRHGIDSDAPTTRTVNGQVDPVLQVRTNRTELLRLANIGADIWYRLRLAGAQFHVIAEDANPVAQVWTADQLVLPPGKRYDVLVRWPRTGTFALRTLRYSTGPAGDDYPARRLATFEVHGSPVADVAWPTTLGPVSPLATDRVDRTRHLVFSENPRTNQFFINGRQFDAQHVNYVAKLGTTEEWVIRNTSREEHPFHIHVNDFEVMSVNGTPYQARSEQDVVALPSRGVVRIRMHFTRFVGATVFHCHILAHEDGGMMGIIDITRSGRPSAATARSLRAMNAAMLAQHSTDMSDDPGHGMAMPSH
ncbi:multicopper oxidase family protein [Nocardioides panacis]|uniref:Multicopper oxidase family protein n=1 Tax=Nocardioides panacis TaxID=2849501 RepID=A0A975T1L7_9ACTN|nr:multicopper oxidase family protein [Nocardioides panacis]QWZ09360.1 multicopper oxidase family protein [Nocardioides panacis]